MNETLIANWNNVVTPDDVVYHLGDFAFGDALGVDRVMRRLNFAHFHFIMGNHDKPFIDWYHNFGNEELTRKVTVYPHFLETKIQGNKFTLCHYAMRVWNESHRGAMHLYGHSHGTLPDDPNSKSFDVGVDCHAYRPISLERVLAIMATKQQENNYV
jgi:calcineurin-like phosphoesterase family protein